MTVDLARNTTESRAGENTETKGLFQIPKQGNTTHRYTESTQPWKWKKNGNNVGEECVYDEQL